MKGTDRHPHRRFPMPALFRCRPAKGRGGQPLPLASHAPCHSRDRPGWIVGENVGGILTMVQPGKAAHVGCQPSLFGEDQPVYRKREEYVVETICRDLEREGYTVQPLLIPACAVGAPHRRDRIWLLPTPMARGLQPEGTERLQKGLPEIIREMLLPTPTATEIHHRQRVERWKRQGRVSMHETEDGEKNPNGLTDFLDFHGCSRHRLQGTGRARRPWKISKGRGRNPHQGSLPDFFARAGRSFQLNPLFVAEMMGFPVNWTVLPFLPGGSSPSRDMETPSSPR